MHQRLLRTCTSSYLSSATCLHHSVIPLASRKETEIAAKRRHNFQPFGYGSSQILSSEADILRLSPYALLSD